MVLHPTFNLANIQRLSDILIGMVQKHVANDGNRDKTKVRKQVFSKINFTSKNYVAKKEKENTGATL